MVGDELLRHRCVGHSDLVATTIVSSQLLQKLANQYGSDYRETLTGFKWLANAAIEKERSGGRFLFGFEEALGYSVGPVVRDKDGISVALILVDLVSQLKGSAQTLLDRLREIYSTHGVHASSQYSVTLPGASGRAKIESMLSSLRDNPPETVGGLTVIKRIDYQLGLTTQDGQTQPLNGSMPPSNVLAFYLSDGTRILARPSGTEPKIKFYFECVVPLAAEESLTIGEDKANRQLNSVQQAFLNAVGLSD